jgi:hypothetical protein
MGHLEMAKLLLERGADIERVGHYGTALGFAVHSRKPDIVQLLLANGADAPVTVPLFVLLEGGPPHPHSANLLYIAMDLRHPSTPRRVRTKGYDTVPKWQGLPLPAQRRRLMAMLMTYGASSETTLATISRYLVSLAAEARHTEEEYLAVVRTMLKEAEAVSGISIAGKSRIVDQWIFH